MAGEEISTSTRGAAAPERPAWTSRPLAALELIAGTAVVVGHNVYRVLPNEVLLLLLVGLLSIRWRSGGLPAIGLVRPASWRRVFALAAAAAAVRIVLPEVTYLPILARFWPEPAAPAAASEIPGSLPHALIALAVVWTLAAFGEEFVYRGYLLLRAAEALGGGRAAQWPGVVATAVLFGIGHYYKGPAGMIDSGFAGLLLGAAYLLAGRNLWAAILAHGLIDTTGVVLLYLALDG